MSIPWKQRDKPERLALRLLRHAPIERACLGGWRWGTRRIGPTVIDSLVAQGLVAEDGRRAWLVGKGLLNLRA